MTRTEELREYCELYDRPNLECDGATRVFSWLLKQKGVPHTLMMGRLEYQHEEDKEPQVVEPHFWIELDDTGEIVDYKAQMWLGDMESVPHGIFKPGDYPKALYVGNEVAMLVCKTVFDILTREPSE